jgi:hypothetical protein
MGKSPEHELGERAHRVVVGERRTQHLGYDGVKDIRLAT